MRKINVNFKDKFERLDFRLSRISSLFDQFERLIFLGWGSFGHLEQTNSRYTWIYRDIQYTWIYWDTWIYRDIEYLDILGYRIPGYTGIHSIPGYRRIYLAYLDIQGYIVYLDILGYLDIQGYRIPGYTGIYSIPGYTRIYLAYLDIQGYILYLDIQGYIQRGLVVNYIPCYSA